MGLQNPLLTVNYSKLQLTTTGVPNEHYLKQRNQKKRIETKCLYLKLGEMILNKNLVFNKAIMSSNDGIVLNICIFLDGFLSDSATYSFSFDMIGADRLASMIESGRKTFIYTAATTATNAAT